MVISHIIFLFLKISTVNLQVHSQDEYCQKMMELSGALDKDAAVPDFLEATIYTKQDAVIMVGNFADVDSAEKRGKVNPVTAWYKPWFYKHTESFLHRGGEEYVPIQDYLLRHNRAIFWVLESMIPFGNHPLFRWEINYHRMTV